jgi:hypothetical protein
MGCLEGVKMSTSKFNSKNANSKSEPVYAGGRVVGQVRNGTFYKSIAVNHYLRKPPAIAFSLDSLQQAEQAGAVRVEVRDRETGTIYRATLAHIRERGFSVNRAGFEPQIALPLDGWTKQTKGAPMQPSLFVEVP